MTIGDDSRTYECPNCGLIKRMVAPIIRGEKARYVSCPECPDYEMAWVED